MPLPPPHDRRVWTPPPYLRTNQTAAEPTGPIIDVTPTEIIPPKPTIDQIPTHRYSQIIAAQFVQHKLVPQRIIPIADVEYMDWEFDEPLDDDDNEVRVYVSISEEERAIIKRYGYHHEPLEKDVPLFDGMDMQHLQDAQERELESADPNTHAFLRMEHKQQLEWAQEQKIDLTIIDYLASPFRKQCVNRFEATLAERKMNGKLMEFKKKLDGHRAK